MTSNFTVVLRGYEREQVDQLLAQTDAAVASSDEALRASARKLLQNANLAVVLRGYARDQVDDAIRDRLREVGLTTLDAPPLSTVPSSFVVALRGYDMAEVDDAFGRVEVATRSHDVFMRAAVRDALRAADFSVRIRGYARAQVDRAVREAVHRLS